ncbi:MAG: putative glycosyl hydrolase [Pedosphaera sp.]|nr:putative glycosyl hydrolase [Pedosphaera sp.]
MKLTLVFCLVCRWPAVLCLRNAALVCIIVLSGVSSADAQTYIPPANHRSDILLNTGWRFIRQVVSGAQNTSFDDSTWSVVNLPHTWNNLDGQDGGNNYYRGIGWYRTHYAVDAGYAGRQFFLKFDGACLVADVWLNGNYLGQHQGGFAAFVFDVTPYINVGVDNVIAVKVDNSANANIPPLDADFTFFGGIYRDAHLLVTDPVQVSPLDYGSPGVYLKPTSVSSNSANLQITAVLSNANVTPTLITVRTVVTDAGSNIVKMLTNAVTLQPGSASNLVASMTIASPHLWNGLVDPYLYRTFIEIYNGPSVIDVVSQSVGFRWFSVDPTNGFFLNGRRYDLHGVNMHQDWLDQGWAIGDQERLTNFMLLKEIGATAVRLSHYEHAEHTYQLADQNGLILWTEIPLIDRIMESPAFYTNAQQQLRELIRQRYNHPSVVLWGIFNEITLQAGPTPTNLLNQLAQLVIQEDPTRPSSAAANSSDSDPSSLYTQLIAFNKYYGWYSSPANGIGAWADNIHANYPNRRVGITEYGAGASIYQHSENPIQPGNTATAFHPEEWQNLVHESHWQSMNARPFLWCKFLWNMFDFAADGRNEGDTPGRNDKGLVTYDRRIRKDAFYYYQANWTTNPMVYITGHTFTNRLTNSITAKIYANCDSVELFLNGVSQGTRASTNCIFAWPITLNPGSNAVQATGTKGGTQVSDSLVWMGPVVPPSVAITSPAAAVVYLNSTNDVLLLSAVATNSPQAPGPLTTSWTQRTGPGRVTFSDVNGYSTTAAFNADGIYSVSFAASNGATASASLAVVVNSNTNLQSGLLAWWKMDEAGGTSAVDSSGNGLSATISGGIFTTGFLSNALHLNGAGNVATFTSPDTSQITLAAWVRADGRGNSAFPRVLETPGYRLFFRFDAQGTNGFDFATFSTSQNGDWFSGQDSVKTGAWYHVAASYDRSIPANLPVLYVNGAELVPVTITSPVGTQPAYNGTGYIGNRSTLDRAWNGSLDDIRIYNRLLSAAEVQVLAAIRSANFAPIVRAGTNQTVLWPDSAVLGGMVADDGKPNVSGVVSVAWSKLTGPGIVTFADSNAPATTASFSTTGTYVLRLAAYDGQVETVDDMTITAIMRPAISANLIPGALQLSWPTNVGNWHLQYQTNSPSTGLEMNWTDIPGPITNPYIMPLDVNAGSVFYRLLFTN